MIDEIVAIAQRFKASETLLGIETSAMMSTLCIGARIKLQSL